MEVSNVYATGNTNGTDKAGGLIGYNWGNASHYYAGGGVTAGDIAAALAVNVG
ncbi:hypothetical protein [Halalkalibacter oceani]|uniref:hypothetical protein n=1 Tax=Halalkalibacter oceani TaxID=1653776 RepID=UPI0020405384|nr:hypothetical protein [Halalkalibacter oceani]MCM3762019.1 hypothetical protein [Halalkalibacter oceani]